MRARRSAPRWRLIAVELRHLQRTELRRGAGGLQARPEGLSARCRTSATRSAPRRSAACRGCCAATCKPACRTSRCGTSATSRTARSSESCCPTVALLAYYVLRRMNRLLQGLQVFPRPDAGQPAEQLRPGLQPAGAARPGPGRLDARRGVSHRAGRMPLGHGTRVATSVSCSRPTRGSTVPRSRARRCVRSRSARCATLGGGRRRARRADRRGRGCGQARG